MALGGSNQGQTTTWAPHPCESAGQGRVAARKRRRATRPAGGLPVSTKCYGCGSEVRQENDSSGQSARQLATAGISARTATLASSSDLEVNRPPFAALAGPAP